MFYIKPHYMQCKTIGDSFEYVFCNVYFYWSHNKNKLKLSFIAVDYAETVVFGNKKVVGFFEFFLACLCEKYLAYFSFFFSSSSSSASKK